jgi:hypothetical protein
MTLKSIFQNRLIPLEYVSLGRFITDPEYPQRGFHSPFQDETLPTSTVLQQDLQELLTRNRGTGAGYRLTEAFSLFRSIRKEAGAYVTATLATRYELQQWDQVFRQACAKVDARMWLEDAIEDGKDVYFIVGFRTFRDPKVAELAASSKSHGVEVQLPVSAVVQANAPGLMLGGVLDPGVSTSRANAVQSARSFDAIGEYVYAIEYCKVRFKWYSSKKVESSSLGQTKWKVHWGVRAGAEEVEDDVVEAEVVEDLEVDKDIPTKALAHRQ